MAAQQSLLEHLLWGLGVEETVAGTPWALEPARCPGLVPREAGSAERPH